MKNVKIGSMVEYIGDKHSALEKGTEYEVKEVYEEGIRVIIKTGFCGIKNTNFFIKN